MTPPFDDFEAHVGSVYRYAMRLAGRTDLAEDLTQETLLRAWRHRHKLREERAVRVWLLRIATNLWTDQLRQAKLQPQVLPCEPPCRRLRPAEANDQREAVMAALAAMDELPPRQRQVLYLVACEAMSHAEAADVLGISVAAVTANLSLARKEMRQRLKPIYEEFAGRRASHDR